VLHLEAYSRRENLVFMNIPDEKEENCALKISTILKKKMKISEPIQFSRVHRLGAYSKDSTRPIIVRFHYAPDRMRVWSARTMLKGSDIIIREDYPNEMEKARRTLRPIHNHALFLGKDSRLVKDSVIIEGTRYNIKNIDTLPVCLQPRSICERTVSTENGEYLLFFGKNSPLSNWYSAKFEIGGHTYSSTEQYFMYRKALFAKDSRRAEEILKKDDPQQIKRIGNAIRVNHTEWKIPGTYAMEEALKAKFEQNKDLKDYLVSTGHKVLVECTRDRLWGCGHHLHSKEATNRSKWEGENMQGTLLNQLRSNLSETWTPSP